MWPLSDHNGCGLPGILTSPLLRLRPRHKAFCSCNTRGSSYPVSNTTDAVAQVRGNLEGAAIDPLTTAYVLPCAPKNTRSRKCSCNTHPSTVSATPETRLLMLLTPTTVLGVGGFSQCFLTEQHKIYWSWKVLFIIKRYLGCLLKPVSPRRLKNYRIHPALQLQWWGTASVLHPHPITLAWKPAAAGDIVSKQCF